MRGSTTFASAFEREAQRRGPEAETEKKLEKKFGGFEKKTYLCTAKDSTPGKLVSGYKEERSLKVLAREKERDKEA